MKTILMQFVRFAIICALFYSQFSFSEDFLENADLGGMAGVIYCSEPQVDEVRKTDGSLMRIFTYDKCSSPFQKTYQVKIALNLAETFSRAFNGISPGVMIWCFSINQIVGKYKGFGVEASYLLGESKMYFLSESGSICNVDSIMIGGGFRFGLREMEINEVHREAESAE